MAKKATKKTPKEDSELLKALKFVSFAQQDVGSVGETHCAITNGYVTAFNGIVGAGYPCAEEITCFPHTKSLIDALGKVRGAMSLSLLPSDQLSVKDGEKFRALIPTVYGASLPYVAPDPKNWPLNDNFKKAGEIAGIYTTDGAQTVMGASILTRDYSLVGTNGSAVIEVAHGNPTPPGVILPKSFFSALAKVAEPIVGFGFSHENSFTVWFENGAWIKTQQYVERWPNVADLLDRIQTMTLSDITPGLFEAVEVIASFSQDGRFYIDRNIIRSHPDESQGATYSCPGVNGPVSLNVRGFLAVKAYAETMAFGIEDNSNMIAWMGKADEIMMRGALVKYH